MVIDQRQLRQQGRGFGFGHQHQHRHGQVRRMMGLPQPAVWSRTPNQRLGRYYTANMPPSGYVWMYNQVTGERKAVRVSDKGTLKALR